MLNRELEGGGVDGVNGNAGGVIKMRMGLIVMRHATSLLSEKS